ncbi:Cytochrome p450 [Aspergillus sclerotialis]|uniref:Cytochrome p450 n=1 Tax=Aspergillus sclerotialis TaxID=2070753 RepID=A0A3A2ZH21_9EURO|nr:Cytochrome p450 [Aspergillus sclerotialis]
MAEDILAFPGASATASVDRTLERVFGDRGPIRNLSPASRRELDQNMISFWKQTPNVYESSTSLIRLIKRESPNLVTFCRSPVDQAPWERASHAVVGDSNPTVCEVNLFALVRNFVGHVTTSAFMGQALNDTFPRLLEDLWKLDDQLVPLSLGVSRWIPLPGASTACAARGQLLHALTVFHEAFTSWEDGIDPGIKFRDFDDVSEPVKRQIQTLRKFNLGASASAPGHLSLLWALNARVATIAFWNILRIFSDRSLLEDVRKEIAPCASAMRPSREETGFPFQEPPRLSIDPEGLQNSCPLLKASYYETLRLDTAPLSFRKLTSDISLTESIEDAQDAGLTHRRTYRIKKGENIVIPHGIFHKDAKYFSNPDQYDPRRFIQTDHGTGAKAHMHPMKPVGGIFGYDSCMSVEREILPFVAAIVAMWEIEPASDKDLIIPERKIANMTFLPKKDIRVKLRSTV